MSMEAFPRTAHPINDVARLNFSWHFSHAARDAAQVVTSFHHTSTRVTTRDSIAWTREKCKRPYRIV